MIVPIHNDEPLGNSENARNPTSVLRKNLENPMGVKKETSAN